MSEESKVYKFLDKLLFAVEKIIALITSQRGVVGIVALVFVVWSLTSFIAPLVGIAVDPLPDDEALNAKVGQMLVVAASLLGAFATVLGVFKSIIEGTTKRPPTLRRDDYVNLH